MLFFKDRQYYYTLHRSIMCYFEGAGGGAAEL